MLTPVCDCKVANHEHGEASMYVHHKCRCDVCKAGNRERERARNRARLYGRSRLTDAEPARVHVRELMAAGMGIKRIATVAGISPGRISDLLYGRGGTDPRPPRKQINKEFEAKLLAVTVDLAPGATVDDLGSIRRLKALVAMGWSQHRLAELLDMESTNLGRIIHGDRFEIRLSTARRIAEIFDARWDKTPPATTRFERAGVTRAKEYAKAHGWVTAAAWDDIDDPTEKPKADLEDESIAPQSRASLEKIDRLELLILDGYGDDDATYIRAGWASRLSGWAVLRRMGREDLIERLHRNDLVRQVAS